MDIETCIDETRSALSDKEESELIACYYIWEGSNSGAYKWAKLMAKNCKLSDDQIYNKANAWSMYLTLLDYTEKADDYIGGEDGLYVSHLYSTFRDKYLETTDTSQLCDALIQAHEEGLSVIEYIAKLLEPIAGADPHDKYMARFDRFKDELKYIIGMAEANGISEAEQMLLKNLKLGLEIIEQSR